VDRSVVVVAIVDESGGDEQGGGEAEGGVSVFGSAVGVVAELAVVGEPGLGAFADPAVSEADELDASLGGVAWITLTLSLG
jgi:hypothetical protein